MIADSIKQFGFTNPILIDDAGLILAGHGRFEAAGLLGLAEVPTITLSHMSAAEKRADAIADNRLAEKAGWDRETLALEFGQIVELDEEFEIVRTGFDLEEVELIIDAAWSDGIENDRVEVPESGCATTRLGDLWKLGEHQIICGDALQQETYRKLLGKERAHTVVSDLPYNVPIAGHVSGLGKARHRESLQASGEMSEAEFVRFLIAAMILMARFSRSGSLHYLFMDWRHIDEMMRAGRSVYDHFVNLCVWAKTNGGMGSLYRSRHELVFVFKKGDRPHTNNVKLGANGRYRTNVWEYSGANSFSADRDEALAMHPTVKPVPLIADAIMDASHRGEIVLDPFAGSGTTGIAAAKTDRIARLAELDPLYCDVILRRFEKVLGIEPLLLETGEPFSQVETRRRGEEMGDE